MVKEILERMLYQRLSDFDSKYSTDFTKALYNGSDKIIEEDSAVEKILNDSLTHLKEYKKQPEYLEVKDIIDDVIKSIRISRPRSEEPTRTKGFNKRGLAGLSFGM